MSATSTGRKIAPILLIGIPMLLLIGIGVMYNNFQNSGFSTTVDSSTCTQLNCPAYQSTGCAANSANCQFTSSTSFSFLNPNSPFTLLVEGNVIGFLSNTFRNGESQQIIYSGYTTCIPQLNAVYANATGAGINSFQCLGYIAYGSGQLPAVQSPLNATSNNGNNSVWTVEGCSATSTCHLNYGNGEESFNGTWNYMSFYAFYIKNGTTLTASSGCTIYGSVQTCQVLMPWLFSTSTTFTCPNAGNHPGFIANATYYYCLIPVNNPDTPTSSTTVTSQLPNNFAAVSWLFGVILFFLGFGLSVSTAIAGFNINEQGTRLAQIAGLGIILYSFAYGEFSNWLSLLGFGLDAILTVILAASFFVGIFWQSQSFL